MDLFHLIPGDIGRPLDDLKHQLDYPEMKERCGARSAHLDPAGARSRGRERPLVSFAVAAVSLDRGSDRRGGALLRRYHRASAGGNCHARVRRAAPSRRRERAGLRHFLARPSTGASRAGTQALIGILGYTENEAVGQMGDIIFTEEDRAAGAPAQEAATAMAEGRASDERWHRVQGWPTVLGERSDDGDARCAAEKRSAW